MNIDLFTSDAQKPKYGRIQDHILANIQKGDWSPGDRIPSERNLAQLYEASVGTVRNAIQNLANQGYLTREQGRGTYVKTSTVHTDSLRYFRFATDFENVVQPLSITSVQQPRLKAGPEVAAVFKVDPLTEFFEVKRTFNLKHQPLVFVTSYLPRALFPDFGDLSTQVIEEIPLYLLVEGKYNMPTLALKERFSAVAATAEVAKRLQLEPGVPVQKISMVAFTTRNTLYEYQISYCDTTHMQIFPGNAPTNSRIITPWRPL